MRHLMLAVLLSLSTAACTVAISPGTFPAHPDPTIANDEARGPQLSTWSVHGRHRSGWITFDLRRYQEYLAHRTDSDRIPDPIRVTEIVPEAVLDRLDAQRKL